MWFTKACDVFRRGERPLPYRGFEPKRLLQLITEQPAGVWDDEADTEFQLLESSSGVIYEGHVDVCRDDVESCGSNTIVFSDSE